MKHLVCVLAITFAGTAFAEKPTIAVLGVIPRDASLVKSTTTLDAAIRTRLAAKASPYRVKGTSKQVADAIRTAECSTSETACATKLAEAIGADFALAGELEKLGTHVELTVQIIDVATKKRIRVLRDKIAGNVDFKKLAKKTIDKLTGVGEMGELVVVANVARGDIFINDELKSELFEGRASLVLPQGRYKLAIQAAGKKRFEDLVNVDQTTQLNVLLD